MEEADKNMDTDNGTISHKEEQNSVEEVKVDPESKTPNLDAATSKLAKWKYHVVKSEEDGMHRFLQTGSNKKFEFVSQKHYDKLGDVLCEWIQALMMDKYGLQKVHVPFKKDLTEGYAQAPIFVSKDWETNSDRALVLIQGTGDVRSGYWARSVCMNDTLELGSMLPDIEFAQNNGMSVLVMNPNYNRDAKDNRVDKLIRGMNHHSNYVWKNFVENDKCPAKEVFMVAHSAGGGCAHEIIVNNEDTMVNKVRAIALTDACHGRFYKELGEEGREWVVESCIAYDASNTPLDTPLVNKYYKSDFPEVSAGHPKHVYTTGCARESYLKWFVKRSPSLNAKL